jgi:hypothetical protein
MDSEVSVVVENQGEERKEDCMECMFVELGQVSRDTQGSGFWGVSDPGMYRRL